MIPRKRRAGGGWQAVRYTLDKALEVGPLKLWKRMRSKNACKTCAVGMGGQLGGMVNEQRHFPEVCKKSLQAQVADMQGAIAVDYFDRHPLAQLKALSPKQAEDEGRLTYPIVLRRGAEKFQPISWESALEYLAESLKGCAPERAAFYSSGRSSNEAGFLLQSFARVFGTNNVMNCSFYCHQASGVGLKLAFGTGTATIDIDDLSKTDLLILVGANPASNHPRLMTQLANIRGRGGKIVVVNPIREGGLEKFHVPSQPLSMLFGTQISSFYVQPLAGGDVALFVGVLKSLVEQNRIDYSFLKQNVVGYEQVIEDAAQSKWSQLVTESGVSKDQIEKLATMIAQSKAAVFAWAMGITHHKSGVENVLALCNVALATGNVGKSGAGMLPIRGHSNVQGIGSIGVAPALQDVVRQSLEKLYNKALPTVPGYDTLATLEAAHRTELDFLFSLGGNLWGSNPDLNFATSAFSKIKTVVYLSTKLNPGHFYGAGETTIILPVLARDEEPQSTTQESMFNFVRLSQGGEPNVRGQMRAETDVICDLANRVLGNAPVDWHRLRDHDQVRKLIAEAIPGWQAIAEIGETKKEFTVAGRVFHQPTFPTPDARAAMHRTPLPKFDPTALRLMTLRSEGQFNTVVYEEYDLYRGIPHRFCVLLSNEDAKKLGIKDGQRVRVKGEAGQLENIEVVVGAIREGVAAMYYPEANVLIKPNIDPRSKTPAFKSAPIWIEP